MVRRARSAGPSLCNDLEVEQVTGLGCGYDIPFQLEQRDRLANRRLGIAIEIGQTKDSGRCESRRCDHVQ